MSIDLKNSVFVLASVLLIVGKPAIAEIREHDRATGQFNTIEQPLPIKIAITLGGMTLIGLELWWFLGSRTSEKTNHHG
ncbi:MAG: hypothetical protein J7642_10360 [Cyanobacteria bacterium SBC]|nr:hypothetical protein [Cyanobacteria bacterium SBC]